MVRVDGHLDTPIYRWPRGLAIVLCLLAPVAYGLEVGRFRGFGRFRPIVLLLRWIGPAWFLGLGLASLLFALGVRMALIARRKDLEILDGGNFALIDRQGRREFADSQVVALGYRTHAVVDGKDLARRGDASLWLETREGEEQVALSWRYADGEADPLADWLHGLLDQLHARASREVEAGRTLEGEGWTLSRDGLNPGGSREFLPVEAMAEVEYLDGQLAVWERDRVEPTFRVGEGSKNVAILHALLADRMTSDSESTAVEPTASPLGRLLFERRASVKDRVGLWLMCGILAVSLVVGLAIGGGGRGRGRPRRPVRPPVLAIAFCLAFTPALIRQFSVFRFHERGVSRSGLLGRWTLPFEDLAEVKSRPLQGGPRWEFRFVPIAGRKRVPVVLVTNHADEALTTLWRYAPAGKV